MLLHSIFIFYLTITLSHGNTEKYDRYTAKPITGDDLAEYEKLGVVENCTIDIKPCKENEWRRVDGSCNNAKYPARGTHFVPMKRLLPANYYNGSYPRKSASGKDLTLPRVVRTTVLREGLLKHQDLTQLLPGYMLYSFFDFGSIHDIRNFVLVKNDCCQKEHMNDYECTPNIIPEDDPVHRFSGIRCMNLTRPLTYQDFKCTKDPTPSPIQQATPSFDLSFLYNFNNEGDQVIRSFEGGMLAAEEEDGKIWPPNGPSSNCPMNQGDETRCFKNFLNSLLPVNMCTVWYFRHHNYIAKKLAEVNPCWDDETLFQHARDINIAFAQQIFTYEVAPLLIGYKTLVKAGIIGDHPGFRDIYDKKSYPVVTLEFAYALRWFHTIQDQTSKLIDTNGKEVGEYPMFNITFKTGWMAKENRMTYLTQGIFREATHDSDHSITYDVAERGVPGLQLAVDIATSDLHKGRLLGMPSYHEYVNYFSGINITSFKDLTQMMKPSHITSLKEVYETVEDIDLMAGLWSENLIEGGKIPRTLAHIIQTMMLNTIKGDKHWYERKSRPHAFTLNQLLEVRKSVVASLICAVGDGVTEIQKRAFLNISPENPLVNCSEIPHIDFSAWADPTCNAQNKDL